MYLKWEVIARSNTRSCSYAKRDMIASLEAEGCIVVQGMSNAPPIIARRILTVYRVLAEDEDPRTVRGEVTSRIRIVHPKAGKRFKGLHDGTPNI